MRTSVPPVTPFLAARGQRLRGALVWLALAAYTIVLMTADPHTGPAGQLGLGALTALILVELMRRLRPAYRLQAALVIGVATIAEVFGSIVWGAYRYRMHNLPAFVPPGHGLVYIGGLALAAAFASRADRLVRLAAAGLAAWGIAGLTVLPRLDVTGACGCAILLFVLWRTRNAVYAGVFFGVAIVELYGTARGVWAWAPRLPELGAPTGNPPSGAAAGYVFFDVAAIALTPGALRLNAWLMARVRAFGEGWRRAPRMPPSRRLAPAPLLTAGLDGDRTER